MNQLKAEKESLRFVTELMKKSRETKRQDSNKPQATGTRYFWRKIKRLLSFKGSSLLLTDLEPLDSELKSKNVEEEVNDLLEQSDKRDIQASYKTIIHKVGSKELRIVWMLEVLENFMNYLFLCSLQYFLLAIWSHELLESNSTNSNQIHYTLGDYFALLSLDVNRRQGLFQASVPAHLNSDIICSGVLTLFMFIASMSLSTWQDSYFKRAEHKIKQTLALMIFNKLVYTDAYFLEHCNNHLMSRLFYKDFEAFTPRTLGLDLMNVGINSVILVIFYVRCPNWQLSMSIFIAYFLFFLTQGILITFKLRYSLLLRDLSFDRTKHLYEYLVNFKHLHTQSLVTKATKELNEFRNLEVQNKIKKRRIEFCMESSMKIFPLVLLGINNYFLLKDLSNNIRIEALEDSLPILYFMITNWILYIILSRIKTSTERFSRNIEQSIHSRKSEIFYDNFFEQIHIIENVLQDDETLKKGEIVMESCEAYQRSPQTLKDIFEFLLYNKRSEYAMVKQRNNLKFKASSAEGVKKQTIMQRNILKPDLHKVDLLVHSISCHIKHKDKICLFGDMDDSLLSFMKVILGETHLKSGSFKKNGLISYLNTSTDRLIAGKTIQENIMIGEQDMKRYLNIIRKLNLDFSGYAGGEFHEVHERGTNIAKNDREMILISRFLYKKADIYLIESLFNDKVSLEIDARIIFRDILIFQTIIFISKDINLIKESNKVFLFENHTLSEVVDTQKFVHDYKEYEEQVAATTSPRELDNRERMMTTKRRINNSFLFQNISFEHELNQHRKKIKQIEETEKVVRGKSSIECMIYGIYLAQRKRDEGSNNSKDLKLTDSYKRKAREEWRSLMYRSLKSNWWLFLFLIFYTIMESVIELRFINVYKTWVRHPPSLSTKYVDYSFLLEDERFVKLSILITPILIFGCAFLVRMFLMKFVIEAFSETHRKLISKMMTASISENNTYRTESLIQLIDIDFQNITEDLPKSLLQFLMNSIYVLHYSILASYYTYLAYLVIVIEIALFICYNWYAVKAFTGNMFPLQDKTFKKFQSFYFQLITLIPQYRSMKQLDNLTHLFQSTLDQSTLCNLKIRDDFNRFIFLVARLKGVCIMAVSILTSVLLVKNYWPLKFDDVIWGSFAMILYSYKMYSIGMDSAYFTVNFMPAVLSLINIDNFLNKQGGVAEATSEVKLISDPPKRIKLAFKLTDIYLSVGSKLMLKSFNLAIGLKKKGAILGGQGVGRNYIFELLLGQRTFEPRPSSSIRMMDQKFRKISDHPDTITFLEINPVLFEGTIRSNIDPHGLATDPEIYQLVLEYLGTDILEAFICDVIDDVKILHKKATTIKAQIPRSISPLMKLPIDAIPEAQRGEEDPTPRNELGSPRIGSFFNRSQNRDLSNSLLFSRKPKVRTSSFFNMELNEDQLSPLKMTKKRKESKLSNISEKKDKEERSEIAFSHLNVNLEREEVAMINDSSRKVFITDIKGKPPARINLELEHKIEEGIHQEEMQEKEGSMDKPLPRITPFDKSSIWRNQSGATTQDLKLQKKLPVKYMQQKEKKFKEHLLKKKRALKEMVIAVLPSSSKHILQQQLANNSSYMKKSKSGVNSHPQE